MKKYSFYLIVLISSFFCTSKVMARCEDNDTTLTILAGDTTLQTTYIQNAINYCSSTGGGTVRLSAGTYRTAPLTMKSNITLRIDSAATLLGSPNMADWLVGNSLKNLIGNSGSLTNVRLTGGGTIDGNGRPWWVAFAANNAVARPRLIYLSNVTNLTIDSLSIQNAATFHIVPNNCKNVVIDHVIINTLDPLAKNTDGINPSQCSNVLITNCSISDGDDNIAIKSSGASGISGCQDITVANCFFGVGHGLSIGSGTSSGYTNLRVTGCNFVGTTSGIRIKSARGIGGLVYNIYYSNITMKNVANPIYATFDYPVGAGTDTLTKIPVLNNFFINNLTATGSGNAGIINGLANSILQNIVFTNVNIATTNTKKGMTMSYANGVTFKKVIINKVAAKNGKNVITTNVTGINGF